MFNYNLYCGLPDEEDDHVKYQYSENCIVIGQMSMQIDTDMRLIHTYAEVSFGAIFGIIKTIFMFIMKFFTSFYGLLITAIIGVIAYLMRDKSPKISGGGGGGGGSSATVVPIASNEEAKNKNSNNIELKLDQNVLDGKSDSTESPKTVLVGNVEVTDAPKVQTNFQAQPNNGKSGVRNATPEEVKATGRPVDTSSILMISDASIKKLWDEVYNNEHIIIAMDLGNIVPSTIYDKITEKLNNTNGDILKTIKYIVTDILPSTDILKRDCRYLGNSVMLNTKQSHRFWERLTYQGIWSENVWNQDWQKVARKLIFDIMGDETKRAMNDSLSKNPLKYGICDMNSFPTFFVSHIRSFSDMALNLTKLAVASMELSKIETTSFNEVRKVRDEYREYKKEIDKNKINAYCALCDVSKYASENAHYVSPEKVLNDMDAELKRLSPTHFKELKKLEGGDKFKVFSNEIYIVLNSAINTDHYNTLLEFYAVDNAKNRSKTLEDLKNQIPVMKREFDEAKLKIDSAPKDLSDDTKRYVGTALDAMKYAKVLVDATNTTFNSLNVLLRDAQNPVWKVGAGKIAGVLYTYFACRILNGVYRMEGFDKK